MNLRKIWTALVSIILTVTFILPMTVGAGSYDSEMDSIIENFGKNCEVLVYTKDGQTLYNHNADEQMFGASLIKLPYAVYACRQLSNGVHSLDETMTYTSKWYHGGSGKICYNGYGKVYTIRQLLDYSLRYSDNVAYDMLVYLFGVDGFNSMIGEWGYRDRINNSGYRFPMLTANEMKTAMLEMEAHKNDGECWQVAWDALTHSEGVVVRDTLSGHEVAIKYGQVSYVYHETCFVDGRKPYFLAIFTSTSNMYVDKGFIQKVARCADKMVNELYEKEREDAYNNRFRSNGDVNRNDEIEPMDASLILAEYAANSTGDVGILDDEQRAIADVNKDGMINSTDASYVLALYVHLSTGGELKY